jgi:hypothetical protein
MKKLFVMMISVMIISMVSAQEIKTNWQLSDVTISAGKGALTSGFDTRFDFSNNKDGILFLQANNDRAVVNVGKKFGNFQLIESIGVFKNIPWTGPMLLYQLGPFDFIVWNGVGFAKTKELLAPSYTPQFFFSYEGMGVTIKKNNKLSAAVMWFGNEKPNWFVSYKRTLSVGEKSKFFGEVTYNYNLKIPMFVLGYSMKLNR